MKRKSRPLLNYSVAILATLLVLTLKLLLNPFIDEESPFLLFFAAVLVSAWYGGLVPGFLTTFLGALISDYFFIPPFYGFFEYTSGEIVKLSLFVLEGALISWLTVALSSAKQRAEASMLEIQNNQERLRLSEERFRLLVEGVRDYAIFMLDPEGHVMSWNAGAERIKGYTAEEIIGKHRACFYLPEDIALGKPEHGLTVARDEGQFVEEGWRLRKDGSRYWAIAVITALRDDFGQLRGFSAVLNDITERKQAEEERIQLLLREQKAREEAEAANRSKDQFLAMASHELRTPLNAILGYSQLLAEGDYDGEQKARMLRSIERNAKVQAHLIEDLLDVSRIISGKLRLDVRPIDPIPVIESAIDSVRPAAEAKAIRLKSVLDPSTGLILGDPDRLQQIIWNLLSNAIKFTPEEGEVEISLERILPHVEIRVSDTGVGIPLDFLPHLFERFSQAEGSAKSSRGGLGLGLAIVRHLVELHGGTVQAENREGKGSTFIVRLPVRAVQMRENFPIDPFLNGEEDERRGTLEGIKVLVVDDEADARELLTLVLKERKAEVLAAASVDEALQALEQDKPDILISDLAMPGEDGYRLIRQLRNREGEQREPTPAVALTAYAAWEDRRKALLAGFQAHLSKPVEPVQLAKVVASLARRKRGR